MSDTATPGTRSYESTAWDLIGFDGQVDGEAARVRRKRGSVLYEAVSFNDDTPGDRVRLDRLSVDDEGLRADHVYVDPDTVLVVEIDPPREVGALPEAHDPLIVQHNPNGES